METDQGQKERERSQRYAMFMAEASQSQLRAMYYHTRIQSGVWKERIGKVFQGSHDGPPVTEEVLLAGEVQTMERHIELGQEYLESAKSFISDSNGSYGPSAGKVNYES